MNPKKKTRRYLHTIGEICLQTIREVPPEVANEPELVFNYWNKHIASRGDHNPDKEHFAVLFLNTSRKAMGFEIVSIGTLDSTVVHPREVFRAAIVSGASAIVLIHNHPSGDPSPSRADIEITRKLIHAGRLLKLDVLDHVIVGDECFKSLRENVDCGVLFYA